MIKNFIEAWEKGKGELEKEFSKNHPQDYKDIFKRVVELLENFSNRPKPNKNATYCIDDGDYQGTLLFIVGEKTYQPYRYWYVKIDYGSCSGCDTLRRIQEDNYRNPPTPQQVKDYMTLALHMVQNLKEI